jgi:phage tail sheath protein FI
MAEYRTPGVYIEEIPKLPPSIASVETAIPAFIGYTQTARLKEDGDLNLKPKRISSMLEYEQYFGFPQPESTITVAIDATNPAAPVIQTKVTTPSKYLMYYSLQMFFVNGGGPCYIVSVGDYTGGGVISMATLKAGLDEIEKENEVTLILFPDSINLPSLATYCTLHQEAMDQCALLQDRFTVMDVWMDPDVTVDNTTEFKNIIAGDVNRFKYGAVYYPRIYTMLSYYYKTPGTNTDNDAAVTVTGVGGVSTLAELKAVNDFYYQNAKSVISQMQVLLPASPAVVGKYAFTDNSRGVWKAPANISIDYASRPEIIVTNRMQDTLNVDAVAGKSINVIRSFTGISPALIWGARTLAGNDNEWRYISVRRFFNMVEESTKNATQRFVFEPNDRNTWVQVKSMIENYLTQQWKTGALMGASTKEGMGRKDDSGNRHGRCSPGRVHNPPLHAQNAGRIVRRQTANVKGLPTFRISASAIVNRQS